MDSMKIVFISALSVNSLKNVKVNFAIILRYKEIMVNVDYLLLRGISQNTSVFSSTKTAKNTKFLFDSMLIQKCNGTNSDWCQCHAEEDDYTPAIYFPDNACHCGCRKHHYHCGRCGKLEQVG